MIHQVQEWAKYTWTKNVFSLKNYSTFFLIFLSYPTGLGQVSKKSGTEHIEEVIQRYLDHSRVCWGNEITIIMTS